VFATEDVDVTGEGPYGPPCTPHFYSLFFWFDACCGRRVLVMNVMIVD
jgi:hypothetical protein